jgi:hypothetical protein
MNTTPSSNPRAGITARFDLEPFEQLCTALSKWRIDPFIRLMDSEKAEGRVLGFVRGLRFSAQLIYAIRRVLKGTRLRADWGHVVDPEGLKCSPECDVIIHRGYLGRWNGGRRPVMDFKFVDHEHAVAVISCKSYLTSIDSDYEQYCLKVRKYVKDVWLFAECCPPGAVDRLREKSQEAGYGKFWYLYTWDGEVSFEPNEEAWFDFRDSLTALNNTVSSRGART